MKLCKDCVYCTPFRRQGQVDFYHCALRSYKEDFNPVDGSYHYSNVTTIDCKYERQDSTGFFGLFIDEDRCGVDAKNFKPKKVVGDLL